MPSTLADFQSHILNPSNKHALVTILPSPNVYILNDGLHAYCDLEEITAFVLLLPRTLGMAPVPKRLRQLCQGSVMQNFRKEMPLTLDTQCLVSIGLIFWLDGWDPSASSKSNRSPVHTVTATLLCVDNTTGMVFNSRTFPIACGPGKEDHNVVFQALQQSLSNLSSGNDIVWSHHHGRWTSLRVRVLAFLMDQPERRGSNCLLGGNSKQHPLFGISCNFESLERPLTACPKCLRVASRYLQAGAFQAPMELACRACYGFSISRLIQHGKYHTSVHSVLPVETPGTMLTARPGVLSFELLVDAWQFALRKFVHDRQWSKEDVRLYFTLLCINKATIDVFTLQGSNYLLVRDMAESPAEYAEDVVEYVKAEQESHPHLYALPTPPASWGIGSMNQRVETIMHLAMNTQKAVMKLILHWSADAGLGPTLKKRLQPLITSVQAMRLPFLPCRMFKNDKFGGFVAENYRAFTMLSPWLFRCLLDPEFAPKATVLAPENKPRARWTVKENIAWLKIRGFKPPKNTTAHDLTSIVDAHHQDPAGLPPVILDKTPSVLDIRHLVVLLFRVFGTLFATDLRGHIAGNRFEALVLQFLVCVERVGRACHPDKKQPIWLSKYGMLGLLRCRQHFIDYTYLHSLYEGGIEGEGMVKELRPLCPNAVKDRWPLNLMNAFNRQNILVSLSTGFAPRHLISTPNEDHHDANGKRYSSWADIQHALQHRLPVSVIILGSQTHWRCYALVRMFQVIYAKEIVIGGFPLVADAFGFVYHTVSLGEQEHEHDAETPVVSFGVLLPYYPNNDSVQYCIIDKDWRYVGADKKWTYLN